MGLHSALPNSELHEMKGASSATSGQVPVADGAGSAPFGDLPVASINGLNNANLVYLQARVPDLTSTTSVYVPCPIAGDIVKVITVLQAAIVTDNATLRLQISGVPVTDSDVTITASGSAAGDVDTASPSAANTVTADSAIEVDVLGTATTASAAEVLIVLDVS